LFCVIRGSKENTRRHSQPVSYLHQIYDADYAAAFNAVEGREADVLQRLSSIAETITATAVIDHFAQ